MKKFKPNLFPNEEINLNEIDLTDMAISKKLDGIRLIVGPDWDYVVSRTLKPIRNKIIQERLKPLVEYCKNKNIYFDGEICSENLTYDEIKSCVMNENKQDIPECLVYNIFDLCDMENTPFYKRHEELTYEHIPNLDNKYIDIVTQHTLKNKTVDEIMKITKEFIEQGYEGAILKNLNSYYKFGRYTIKENMGYKIKEFHTSDAKIIDVFERMKVKDSSEKSVNELGYSVTSKKKDDREGSGQIGGFWVESDEFEDFFKVPVKKCTEKEREDMWKKKDFYIGEWIEFTYQKEGSTKKAPRIPCFYRFRESKD
ncbi:MAG: hypothetical protein ACOCRX_08930 [Candidatus Woesearchaeota archaeon]